MKNHSIFRCLANFLNIILSMIIDKIRRNQLKKKQNELQRPNLSNTNPKTEHVNECQDR